MEIIVPDFRFRKLVDETLSRLPPKDRQRLTNYIKSVELRDKLDTGNPLLNGFAVNRTLYGIDVEESKILLSVSALGSLSDAAVMGAIAHELAHAYSFLNFSPEYPDSEETIDEIAIDWGFIDEIKTLREELGRLAKDDPT